jgi:hypothetical protein
MVMRPPSGIASRALRLRLRTAFSSCDGFTLVSHSPPAPLQLDQRHRLSKSLGIEIASIGRPPDACAGSTVQFPTWTQCAARWNG